MKSTLEIVKGVHPGKMIERELLKRKINKRQFALSINEYPQTLGRSEERRVGKEC